MTTRDTSATYKQEYAEEFDKLYLEVFGPNAGGLLWAKNAPHVHSRMKEEGWPSNPYGDEAHEDVQPTIESAPSASPSNGFAVLQQEDIETPALTVNLEDDYLWYPYIKRGTWTVVQGREESGKSTTMRDLASRGSRGWAVPPDDEPSGSEPWGTLWLTAEESTDRVLSGIAAMGGDTGRIVLPDRTLELPRDLREVEGIVDGEGIGLVVLDTYEDFVLPVRRFTDVNRSEGFAIADIIASTEEHGYAAVALRQLKKGQADDAKDKGMGPRSIGGKSHSTLLLGHPAQDEDQNLRVMATVKNRGVPESMTPSLSYRFETSSIDPRFAVVRWDEEESEYTKEDLLKPAYLFSNGGSSSKSVRPDIECIRAFLANGEVMEDECLAHLNTMGFPYKKGAGNTYRFMKRAKVSSKKKEFGGKTYWYRDDLGPSNGVSST